MFYNLVFELSTTDLKRAIGELWLAAVARVIFGSLAAVLRPPLFTLNRSGVRMTSWERKLIL